MDGTTHFFYSSDSIIWFPLSNGSFKCPYGRWLSLNLFRVFQAFFKTFSCCSWRAFYRKSVILMLLISLIFHKQSNQLHVIILELWFAIVYSNIFWRLKNLPQIQYWTNIQNTTESIPSYFRCWNKGNSIHLQRCGELSVFIKKKC